MECQQERQFDNHQRRLDLLQQLSRTQEICSSLFLWGIWAGRFLKKVFQKVLLKKNSSGPDILRQNLRHIFTFSFFHYFNGEIRFKVSWNKNTNMATQDLRLSDTADTEQASRWLAYHRWLYPLSFDVEISRLFCDFIIYPRFLDVLFSTFHQIWPTCQDFRKLWWKRLAASFKRWSHPAGEFLMMIKKSDGLKIVTGGSCGRS